MGAQTEIVGTIGIETAEQGTETARVAGGACHRSEIGRLEGKSRKIVECKKQRTVERKLARREERKGTRKKIPCR